MNLISFCVQTWSHWSTDLYNATTNTTFTPSPSPVLNLFLVALLQGPQVADEAHGKAAPPLGLGVLSQAVQQYPCVPSASQQPQDLHLWEDIRLQRVAGRHSKRPLHWGHLGNSTWAKWCEWSNGRKRLFCTLFFFFFKWGGKGMWVASIQSWSAVC